MDTALAVAACSNIASSPRGPISMPSLLAFADAARGGRAVLRRSPTRCSKVDTPVEAGCRKSSWMLSSDLPRVSGMLMASTATVKRTRPAKRKYAPNADASSRRGVMKATNQLQN